MTAVPAPAMRTGSLPAVRWQIAAVLALIVVGLFLPKEITTYPRAWALPASQWVGAVAERITSDTPIMPGLPTFKDCTRAFAAVLGFLLSALRSALADGFRFEPGDGPPDLPPIPWFAVVVAAGIAARAVGGRGLTILTVAGFAFLAVTGNWRSAMTTLASVVIAAAVAGAIGVAAGVLAQRSPRLRRWSTPVLDLMQTMPVFSYLVPILVLFGFGPVAALAATVIYAAPPMMRATILGLDRVPPERVEFGRMAGCSERQLLTRVLIPSARPTLMLGFNQMIMMTLNMVIIASMIGAGGLGYDVLVALRRLDVGTGLEAGLAIVVLAVVLDRFGQTLATRAAAGRAEAAHGRRAAVLATGVIAVSWAAAVYMPSIAAYPEAAVLSTAPWLNGFVRWVNVTLYEPLDAIKTAVLIWLMVPVKTFLLGLPWFTPPILAAIAGWSLGGAGLAFRCGGMILAIMLVGLQAPAMTTIYLCGLGVFLSVVLGMPIGLLAARSARAHRIVMAGGEILQTMPAFVYLIPVVMLFRVGDFSALVAIVAFAIVPMIRFTDLGLRGVPASLDEAGAMAGCTPRQKLLRIDLPMAMPELLLGLNQTVMMALSMLVITALVGTRDLGQETYIALTKADVGRGIVAGLAIAFIAMTVDRLVGGWSASRRRALGLDA